MPGNKEDICEKIKLDLVKIVNDKDLRNALLLVHSDRLGIHWKYAVGASGPENAPISPENPYHIASIGKTFTSVLIARLYERGLIDYHDPISRYLDSEMLEKLFVYRDVDYSSQVLVRHLLNHTSGIGDYFEDKPISGRSIQELIVEEPDRFWTPDETIDFTRENQRALSAPGKKFHYSDTGYNLLGKIIEKITGKPFHENLDREIFTPLGMDNSYLLFHGQPKVKSQFSIADTFLGSHNVSTYRSISVDWAGGGIVSTLDDLLLFHQALVKNTLMKQETFDLCSRDLGKFGWGMDYGYGILFLNVGKMTLVQPRTMNMWGNFGSIAAFMFYNPSFDTYIIGSFNHSKYVVKQVIFLIGVIRKIRKLV
ncbi:MAG: serine hydrolase [Anaerolineales bacterium]|nr:serine hydrolase [Anaerolineales bacterium]